MDENREALLQLAETVWTAMLDQPFAEVGSDEAEPSAGRITGTIHFSGAWLGRLDVVCPPNAARQVAATMFCPESGVVEESEVRDAVGELANILGGNLKIILPQPTRISLPEVGVGTDAPPSCASDLRIRLGAESVTLRLTPHT
jgi:chemotaxis protein CheX